MLRKECKLFLEMSQAKKRRDTEEFKRESVKLVTEQGDSLAEAARSLGIHTHLIRQWGRKFAEENSGTGLMFLSCQSGFQKSS